jgi:hypothetical protein
MCVVEIFKNIKLLILSATNGLALGAGADFGVQNFHSILPINKKW